MTTEASGRRRRRRPHAAAGARIVAAGVSASTALGLVAVMVEQPAQPAATPVAPTAEPTSSEGRRAPAVAATDAPPVTQSRSS